jgi:hypothetical protein
MMAEQISLQWPAWLTGGDGQVHQDFSAILFPSSLAAHGKYFDIYKKGTAKSWIAEETLPVAQELDHWNPLRVPDLYMPLYGTSVIKAMSAGDRGEVNRHFQAWTLSQFQIGEQAGMVAAAKLVQQMPSMELKAAVALQVLDEARHSEIFALLSRKVGISYPISPELRSIFVQSLSDGRWDMTALGLQLLIEGFALAMFAGIREKTTDPLVGGVMHNISLDEARHIAIGQLSLASYYKELSETELRERREFVIAACRCMVAHLDVAQVWSELGLNVEQCCEAVRLGPVGRRNRRGLFRRVVPLIKSVGLLNGELAAYFDGLGMLDYAGVEAEE